MKRIIQAIVFIIMFGIGSIYGFKLYTSIHYPFVMQHPVLPAWAEEPLRTIDHFTCATVSVVWQSFIYKGIEYTTNFEGNDDIWIRPAGSKYSAWHKISQETFLKMLYPKPINGNKGIFKRGCFK